MPQWFLVLKAEAAKAAMGSLPDSCQGKVAGEMGTSLCYHELNSLREYH
jgi:hypothetical protein